MSACIYRMPKNNPVYNYDFTLWDKECAFKHDAIASRLKALAKRWCFQKEDAGSGIHYQGRFSLKVKKRINEVSLFSAHLSQTSRVNADNDFYVSKEETRVAGPWRDDDLYVPRQVRDIQTLYKWQESILADLKKWDTRTVNILFDSKGGIGKSTLVAYGCCVHANLVRMLPALKNYKDIMGAVLCMPVAKLYFCDMPKGLDKFGQGEFFSAIESIKNGYVFDTRYTFKEKWFDCPNVWIFTNVIPDRSLLSRDRWRYWEVIKGELRALTL